MPRGKFTERDIEEREKFGLGPRPATPYREGAPARNVDNNHPLPCLYNFDEALEILGLGSVKAPRKRRYEHELTFICRAHELALCAEEKETAARKAEALQRAPRLYRRRQQALKRIAAAQQRKERGEGVPADRETTREAMRILRNQNWLPQSLEQEVMRLQLSTGSSFEDCCRELMKQYRSRSTPGRNETNALRNTIHALQAFASDIDSKFAWMDRRKNSGHMQRRRSTTTGRNIPPALIQFLVAVLDAACIKHPDTADSPSKFRRLMARPPECKPIPAAIARRHVKRFL
jgi:hypothetical protein